MGDFAKVCARPIPTKTDKIQSHGQELTARLDERDVWIYATGKIYILPPLYKEGKGGKGTILSRHKRLTHRVGPQTGAKLCRGQDAAEKRLGRD